MAETFRGDGKAVDVVLSADVTKGDVVLAEGWAGIAMASASSGDTVAIEVADRVHEINVGSVAAAKGAVLYLTSAGAISATATNNRPFCKVVKAKNADNYVQAKLLPQLS